LPPPPRLYISFLKSSIMWRSAPAGLAVHACSQGLVRAAVSSPGSVAASKQKLKSYTIMQRH
jgi:hypothetical protein